MELITAKLLAESLMDYHGLNDWTFKFDRAVKRFGLCDHRTKTITLSAPLSEANTEAEVIETMLHEIAHALVGPNHGHDRVWQNKAQQIGSKGERCIEAEDVEAPWKLVCPNCGHSKSRHRKTKTAYSCGKCCKKYNGGEYAEQFAMQWVDARALSIVG